MAPAVLAVRLISLSVLEPLDWLTRWESLIWCYLFCLDYLCCQLFSLTKHRIHGWEGVDDDEGKPHRTRKRGGQHTQCALLNGSAEPSGGLLHHSLCPSDFFSAGCQSVLTSRFTPSSHDTSHSGKQQLVLFCPCLSPCRGLSSSLCPHYARWVVLVQRTHASIQTTLSVTHQCLSRSSSYSRHSLSQRPLPSLRQSLQQLKLLLWLGLRQQQLLLSLQQGP